jgi:hypothetical protein
MYDELVKSQKASPRTKREVLQPIAKPIFFTDFLCRIPDHSFYLSGWFHDNKDFTFDMIISSPFDAEIAWQEQDSSTTDLVHP